MTAQGRKLILILTDIILINLVLIASFLAKYGTDLPQRYMEDAFTIIAATTVISITVFILSGLYRSLWRYASIEEVIMVTMATAAATAALSVCHLIMQCGLPFSVYFIFFVLSTFAIGGSRLSYRILRRIRKYGFRSTLQRDTKRVMLIGAGDAGAMVLKEMKGSNLMLRPVAIIDDDKTKHSRRLMGVKIYGGRELIPAVAEQEAIDEIIIAIPSAPKLTIKDILEECKKTKCTLKTLPGMYEIIGDKVSIQQVRDIQIEDLLGREPISIDLTEICGYIKDQTVLITGGGGSIGSELCRQIAGFTPKKLLILDIYENSSYELQQELYRNHPNLDQEVLIASVRDRQRLESIFGIYKPDVVFHAAAHKHVPLMEHNPSEAIKNNVFGTLNVAECADKFQTKRFVLISTDKAVNPTNLMGATKRIAELIIQALDKNSKTEYVAVRFGNVLGSNGSVIPLFKQQIAAGGPVTVTDPNINRFFMTIPEAVQLVLQAGAMAKGGEIFVLDMGQPVKIADMARDLIRLSGLEPEVDIKIEYTGLRPGEKLYEELLMEGEGLSTTKHKKIFIGQPITIDINTLKQELEKLKFVMIGPKDKIIEFVKDMVPTYVTEEVAVSGEKA